MRRETPLALQLKERIRRHGPITLDAYMIACLNDAEHGYYSKKVAIGREGDFITAPEISQVFGELIGMWAAVVWQSMGSSAQFNLVELGPGRGTLIRDALRAARIVPGLLDAASLHLVDSNATLRETQRNTLDVLSCPVTWHANASRLLTDESSLESGPVIVLANEYLDTFSIEQFVRDGGRWRWRHVTLDDEGNFAFVLGGVASHEPPSRLHAGARDGDVFEHRDGCCNIADDLTRLAAGGRPVAALFIDYGHARTTLGDTLQGVKDHHYVSPFETPGETDLTAMVDFESFTHAIAPTGLVVDGPVTQAEFLGSLGIIERASRLMAANPAKAGVIETGVARLMAPNGMGTRFKAIGIRSAGLPKLPGFGSDSEW